MRGITPRAENARRFTNLTVLAVLLVVVAGALVMSSADAQLPSNPDVIGTSGLQGFIKFEGLDGESVDAAHDGWSDLSTFDQALLGMAAGTSGARAAVPVTFEDIVVAKYLDRTGPKLQDAVAKGINFDEVLIDLTRSFEVNEVFYKYELSNVRVTSYNIGTTGQGDLTPSGLPRIELGGPTIAHSWPVEELSLRYQKIKVTYTEYDNEGQSKGNVEWEWDIAKSAAQ